MARVPYEGVPEEQPETRVPEDYLQAAAPPQAFGEQVGQALQGAGEKLMSTAQFYEEAAADQATNNFLDGRTKLLYGDASKPQMDEHGQTMLGPDGHPIGDGGYLGLRGQAAMDARGDVDQKLNDLIAEQRASLHTRRSQLEFDNQSRRYRAQALEQIGSHYDQQQKVWNKSVNDNTVELMANQVGIDAANPDAVERHIFDASVAAKKNAEIDGVDPEGEILTVKRRLYTAQIESLGATDPRAALQAVKDHADVLAGAPNYRALVDQTRTGAKRWLIGYYSDPSQVPAFGARGVGVGGAPGTPSVPVAPSSEAELDAPDRARTASTAQYYRSKGWNPAAAAGITANLYSESGDVARPRGSNDGGAAFGSAQWHAVRQADFAKWAGHSIQTSTLQEQHDFVNYELTQGRYKGVGDQLRNAKTPEEAAKIIMTGYEVPKDQSPQAIADRQAVARQIAGGKFAPPEGHTAPPAPAGQRAGVGKSAPAAGTTEDQYLAQVREQAKSMLGDAQPDDIEEVVKGVETNIGVKNATEDAAFRQQVKDETAYAEDPGTDLSKLQLNPDLIRAHIPGPEGEQAVKLWQHAIDFHKAVNQIATSSDADAQAIVSGHVPNAPEDYIISAKESKDLADAYLYRQKLLYGDRTTPGDPAGYAARFFPQVATAYSAAIGPHATPADFANYMRTLSGVYDRLGVPEAQRNIFDRQTTAGMVQSISSDPAKGLKTLNAIQAESGAYWPAVYRDLVRNGLNPGMSTALIVASGPNPSDAQIFADALASNNARKAAGKDDLAKEAEGIQVGNGKKSLKVTVDDEIGANPTMSSLRRSFAHGGRAAADQWSGIVSTVRDGALNLYMSGAEGDAKTAADRAIKALTGMYDFVQQGQHQPVRIDKGMKDDFRDVASTVRASLGPEQIRPDPDDPRHPTPERARRIEAYNRARDGYWITINGPDGRAAVQLIDPTTGSPVLKQNGSTFEYYVANIPMLARQARASSPLGQAETFFGGLVQGAEQRAEQGLRAVGAAR